MAYIHEVYEDLNNEFLFEKVAIDEEDLEQSWEDKTVFCYPANTDNLYKWVSKAYRNNKLVAIILPAIKNETWYQRFIQGNVSMEIRKLEKKITFNDKRYASMAVIFYP